MAQESAALQFEIAQRQALVSFKRKKKEDAIAQEKSIESFKEALRLHNSRGITWALKKEFISRLEAGSFKLIDGELKWRDDLSSGDDIQTHPSLKCLVTRGTIKNWSWSETQQPSEVVQPQLLTDKTIVGSNKDVVDDGVLNSKWAQSQAYGKSER